MRHGRCGIIDSPGMSVVLVFIGGVISVALVTLIQAMVVGWWLRRARRARVARRAEPFGRYRSDRECP